MLLTCLFAACQCCVCGVLNFRSFWPYMRRRSLSGCGTKKKMSPTQLCSLIPLNKNQTECEPNWATTTDSWRVRVGVFMGSLSPPLALLDHVDPFLALPAHVVECEQAIFSPSSLMRQSTIISPRETCRVRQRGKYTPHLPVKR